MKLPNHEQALVPQQKITGYLLSFTHRDGRSKAVFFTRFGFSVAAWEQFAEALRQHAANHDVVVIEDTPFGTSYAVEGALATPGGRMPWVRVVWFIDAGQTFPRLVTAYPLRGGDG
jgi:hypothetical protein